jgi:hypothetical protein
MTTLEVEEAAKKSIPWKEKETRKLGQKSVKKSKK